MLCLGMHFKLTMALSRGPLNGRELSTTENEYVATTHATKEVFRLQSLICELFNPLGGFAITEGQTLRRRTRTPRGFKEGECWKLDKPALKPGTRPTP